MKRQALIIGASGHGKVVLSIAQASGFEILGFLDDNQTILVDSICGFPVLGPTAIFKDYAEREELFTIIAIGSNPIRQRLFAQLGELNAKFLKAIHPSSILHESVTLGEGSVIMPGATVNIDSSIGSNCILNTNCSIDHDCVIENHVHIAPGVLLAGNVTVKAGAFMGIGSCAIPGVTVGQGAIVGAGTVLIKDVPDFATVVGNPGNVIQISE